MARKHRLAELSNEELETYRRRLRVEQAAVLAELELRRQLLCLEQQGQTTLFEFLGDSRPKTR